MIARIRTLTTREEGQSMAEYGLILALIAVVAMVAVQAVGTGVAAQFNSVAAQM